MCEEQKKLREIVLRLQTMREEQKKLREIVLRL
jgi:hypothetical protein